MPIPSLQDQFAALIAAPSVSCTQPAWDQSNLPVIELLASWLGDLGFNCEVQTISPGKANLLGFMVCAADDLAARLGYLERKALARLVAVEA